MSAVEVFRVEPARADQVVDVIREAFAEYPVMRFVVGADAADYDQKLRALVRFFVMRRVHRGEPLLGIGRGDSLEAAAIVSRPSDPTDPPQSGALREHVWGELGEAARDRYRLFAEGCAQFDVDVPHLHLNMIGVRARARGTGAGRALLEHVHEISASDRDSEGVTLTTEDERNVPLYLHFGYSIIGETLISPGLRSWSFFRPD